jgi:probable phosphoglycerate mutase
MRLLLIRHGDPDYERDTLTAAGAAEAASLANRLAREGVDHLYASPLGRAKATALQIAAQTRHEVVVEPWLAELSWEIVHPVFGELSAWDLPGEVIRQGPRPDGHALDGFSIVNEPAFRDEFVARTQALDALLDRHGFARCGRLYRPHAPTPARIALVCHGGLGLVLLAHLLDIPLVTAWPCFWLPPSSVTTVLFEQRSPAWAAPRCVGVGDVSHLYADGLPVQPRGLYGNVG